jgi:hypothetical protein
MGISLTGLTPATTYDALIKVGDNGPIDGTLKVLSDGLGTNLPMEASTTGVNLTGSPTVNSVAIANTTQVAAKQDTLVSGTNIKTINGASVLGSGNIPVVTSPSGVSGAIQFSNGSAFASDASNLFWDDTNKRLGIGTNAPTSALHNTGVSRFLSVIIGQAAVTAISNTAQDVAINLSNGSVGIGGFTTFTPSARVHIKGSGSTSATTSLLVQDSSGLQCFKVRDDGQVALGNSSNFIVDAASGPTYNRFELAVGGLSSIASAILSATSTTRGFLPPRMTTTQKNAIASPAAGLVLYDSTTNKLQCYNGSTWNDLF